MIVRIKNITNEKTKFDLLIDPQDVSLDEDSVTVKNPVKFSGLLSKDEEKIRVEGELEAELVLDCDRCLNPTEFHLKTAVDAIFVDENFTSPETERQLAEEDLIVSPLEDETLDLSMVAREQILLALPAHFVCSENCKGLCQKCKINKNINDCDCNQKETDPRWAGLKNLIN